MIQNDLKMRRGSVAFKPCRCRSDPYLMNIVTIPDRAPRIICRRFYEELFCVADSGGGNTNLVVTLLGEHQLFAWNVFDAVWVISLSVEVDSTWGTQVNTGPIEANVVSSSAWTVGTRRR